MNNSLSHFGVLGMKWGVRRSSQKVYRTYGGQKRSHPTQKSIDEAVLRSMKRFFVGDPEHFVKKFPIMNKKYSKLSKRRKAEVDKRINRARAALSGVLVAGLAVKIWSLSKGM